MTSAFYWITELVQWLGSWIPRIAVCQANEGGIKFRNGKRVAVITPGIYIYLPALTPVHTTSMARRTWDLPTQRLTTKDNRTIMVNATVVGSIFDVEKYFVDCFDGEGETIPDRGRKGVVPCVISRTFDEFRDDMTEDAEKEATRGVRSALHPFGIRVEEVFFSDFVETKHISLSTEGDGGYLPLND
jgi:regulator of protease activity HflC (stomatin/prohibitin superfamily)